MTYNKICQYSWHIKVYFIFFKHIVVEFYGNLLAFCGPLLPKVVTKGKLINIQGQDSIIFFCGFRPLEQNPLVTIDFSLQQWANVYSIYVSLALYIKMVSLAGSVLLFPVKPCTRLYIKSKRWDTNWSLNGYKTILYVWPQSPS